MTLVRPWDIDGMFRDELYSGLSCPLTGFKSWRRTYIRRSNYDCSEG